MKYRLGDICSITKGGIGIMKAISGPYTMITLGETDKTHIEYQFDAKAIIIPLVSSTGHGHASMKRVKYCEGKFALGNILCAVIPNDESFVLAKYLHIYLHWNREELLVSQMKGMANVSLPMNRIADVMVTVPSIDKQREIIELEKQLVVKEIEADNLFADQLTLLSNLNQAILQEAVQGKLVKQDPKDEPASELLKRIKIEKLNRHGVSTRAKKDPPAGRAGKPLPPIKPEEIPFEIPENWVWCRLGEVCMKITDGTHHSPTNTNNGDFKYVTAKNIKDDGIDLSNITYVTEEVHREIYSRCNPSQGDVLYIKDGATTGIVTINQLEEEFSMLSSVSLLKIPECTSNEYVMYCMRSPYFYKATRDGMYGVAITRVTLQKINNLLIPLPPLSEQRRIVAEIEKQLAKTKQLKEHIIANQQATEQLLKALLHQAFEVEEKEKV